MSSREALVEYVAKQKQAKAKRDDALRASYVGKPKPQSLEESLKQHYPTLKSRNDKKQQNHNTAITPDLLRQILQIENQRDARVNALQRYAELQRTPNS